MATGDTEDILGRIKSVLPKGWFDQEAPVRDAILGGLAAGLAFVYSLLQYVKNQTRIASASDFFLDLAAFDFFGLRIKRKVGQSDADFSKLIRKEVVRERVTRPGIVNAVHDLTRTPVEMFEPRNANDSGGWGTWKFAFDASGHWGANLPHTFFLDVVQPAGTGIPNLSGLDGSYGGWGVPPYINLGSGWSSGFSSGFGNLYGFEGTGGAFAFADPFLITGAVTNQDIYDMVEATRAAGITSWVAILSPPLPYVQLDINFYLDQSLLM